MLKLQQEALASEHENYNGYLTQTYINNQQLSTSKPYFSSNG